MSQDAMPDSTAEIESLLADRDRLQGWLDRLTEAGGAAPPTVRERVRADYEGRLAEIVARLGSFTTALEASLGHLRSQLAHLGDLRIDAEEARAEAGLRHGVGEYTDDEWRRLEEEAAGRLGSLAADISRLEDEAARFEDVLAQVAPAAMEPGVAGETSDTEVGAAGHGPGADAQAIVREPEELIELPQADSDALDTAEPESLRPIPVEAPRFTPRSGGIERPPLRDRPARTLRFPTPVPEPSPADPVDEMTFLKSVALEAPTTQERPGEPKSGGRAPRSGSSAAKTLKCTDCGAMNRPTEWYCERCGAELAAL